MPTSSACGFHFETSGSAEPDSISARISLSPPGQDARGPILHCGFLGDGLPCGVAGNDKVRSGHHVGVDALARIDADADAPIVIS
jgi:hypothetical protein